MTSKQVGRKRLRRGLVAVGAVLLTAAAALAGRNLWEQRQAADSAAHLLTLAQERLGEGEPAPEPPAAGGNAGTAAPDPLAGYAIDGILSIPALGLELPVLADYSDPLLKLSPCVYEREGEGGRMVSAGHNYRSHFGRLEQLAVGETLTYTPLEGEETRFAVTAVTQIAQDDRPGLEEGEWDLTLLTCNLDMSRRILVRLDRLD